MQTEVIFHATAKGRGKGNIFHERAGKSGIRFNGGVYITSNRDEINDLLNSELMSRNLIKLITPPEIVDKWLRGLVPDKLNDEVLSKVSEEGLRELAKATNLNERTHGNNGAVIKSMLKNKPVTNAVMHILEKYQTEGKEEGVEDFLKLATDAGLVYRSGPWYKYRKGDEENASDDLTLGKTEEKAQLWAVENQDEIKERIK